VFRNMSWGGFVYEPDSRIHERVLYITDPKRTEVVDEYDYWLRTNSSGLVQSSNVIPAKPAIIFLGDSYTEGQGALPWFYELEKRWPQTDPYQIINGGLLGTGFEAWQRLFTNLPITNRNKKVVIIFISDDWTRPVWQFATRDLECLQSADQCGGTNNFLGLPDSPSKADIEIHRIASERVRYLGGIGALIGSSAIYQMLWRPAFYGLWPVSKERTQFEKSKLAIKSLADAVGKENVLLIQLPQKDELLSGMKNRLTEQGLKFIKDSGFRFVDGFGKCRLTIADFHIHDGHPNAGGYAKIVDCVDQSVRNSFRTF